MADGSPARHRLQTFAIYVAQCVAWDNVLHLGVTSSKLKSSITLRATYENVGLLLLDHHRDRESETLWSSG